MQDAHIHRFGNRVAVSLPGKGPTVYLTADEAQQLATAMSNCADEVTAVRYIDSTFGTVTVRINKPD